MNEILTDSWVIFKINITIRSSRASLTISGVGSSEPQLQTGGGWLLFGAVWRVYEPAQVFLEGVQQSLDQGVVRFV